MQSKRIIFCEDSATGAVLVFFLPGFPQDYRDRHYLPHTVRQQGTHRKHSREVPVWMPVRDNACSERKTKNAAAQIMGSSIVFCLG